MEYPFVYGNNFVVVRNVTKRRTWLSWVDYDPYEERDDKMFSIQPSDIANPAPQTKAEEHQTPVKKGLSSKKKE